MPIEESNPERKNLTILSTAIIVYDIAGGKFKDDVVQFPLVSLTFENRENLSLILLFFLLWFCFRYWQYLNQNMPTLINDLNKNGHLSSIRLPSFTYRCASKIINNQNTENTINVSDIQSVFVQNLNINYFKMTTHLQLVRKGSNHVSSYVLKGLNGLCISTIFIIKTIYKNPFFITMYIPYVLFYWALFLLFYYREQKNIQQFFELIL